MLATLQEESAGLLEEGLLGGLAAQGEVADLLEELYYRALL
jgi:hypothetical protein